MVMTNFTISGERVECIARLDSNKQPVFDLILKEDYVEIMRGVDYETFLSACEEIRAELGNLATYWEDSGRKIAEFHGTWCKEAEQE